MTAAGYGLIIPNKHVLCMLPVRCMSIGTLRHAFVVFGFGLVCLDRGCRLVLLLVVVLYTIYIAEYWIDSAGFGGFRQKNNG